MDERQAMKKRALESAIQNKISNIKMGIFAGGTRKSNLELLRDYQREYEALGFGEALGKELTKELDVVIVEPETVKTPRNNINDPNRKASFEEMKKRYKEMSVWKRIQRKMEGATPNWEKWENNASLDAEYFDNKFKNAGRSK